ncbi:putative Metal-dependent hydrolase HDOD [Vibrio nigripulchritudo MADA3029]|uniref:HDOD domain-containing protein n=1 Tax=Vibrio nigripulchritudo TaxID=28173 RepID=UPI0003B19A5B|nr:HDOD domain-containing protein [Vibrio nigripulchritudo]CCN47294.1 putative Metal-dependent hydrolase HDOD [Vibrio nigripulchritudo MADA3020]CCN56094.1 putative Metal-dependent hydrolase HDOD [Vibrio nigripulchritudo MADA3021]CCN60240.1 putative Metal-dependent hydrolase HDOD [Vibrio nigripulchritudo MADA3029]
MDQASLLSRINELPKIRKVLQELVEMVNRDEVDLMQLSQKIAMEQVVSARILRLANSAHFGRSRTVASIDEAVIRLGTEPIRTLVVVSVLTSAFPKFETMDVTEYWNDTFEVATIASNIAKEVGLEPNQVFTAGILHNIGELMIHALAPEEAKSIQERVDAGEAAEDVQREVLGTTASELGAKLATAWKFAPQLVDSIAHCLDPNNAAEEPKIAWSLHLARQINIDWDDIEEEDQRLEYIESNHDAKVLGLSTAFLPTLENVRGQGRDLAAQMV